MSKFDYIVIGGGIIGMMTALELNKQGAKVAIFDRKGLGMESSWAAGGILSPMRPWAEQPVSTELSEQGKLLYPEYVELLKQQTGIDSEYIRSGLVAIDKNHVTKIKNWALSQNINVEDIKNNSFGVNLPEQSVLLPDICQLRPSRLLKALHASLKQTSVSIYEYTKITDIVLKNNLFEYVSFDGGKVAAGAVIIAAGAWSKLVLENINNDIDIKPIRGQIICIKPDEKKSGPMVLDGAHYLIPRQDGHMLIGSTTEDVGFVNQTTESAREELLEWAYSISPSLRNAKFIKHWSGLRPSTVDGKPIIGQMPDIKNIYLNTGHFRKGILQAPASAKLLVDYLSGNSSFMNIDELSIENQ
jgi:glycine oxidase